MITFIGEYTAKIDDKGRVVFPSSFKSLLGTDEEARLVVKKDIFSPCLEMYPIAQWEKRSLEVQEKLDLFNREHAIFWREYMRNSAVVAPDAKLGRITIPEKLLKLIGAEKEIVFYGCDYKIEVWSKENFESSIIPNNEYLAIAENLSSKKSGGQKNV